MDNEKIDPDIKTYIDFLYNAEAYNLLKALLKEYNKNTLLDEKAQNYVRKLLKSKNVI